MVEQGSALRLKNIVKTYGVSPNEVKALKGITIDFRKSEFVAILGPSGCGKTTMLNIIGGLDRYTSGDLLINDISTKKYKDSDWDTYRNNSIGFVFQNYNLIAHQTVLKNVELALTLTGVGKTERKKRALEVLRNVGLTGQENKRPNQLSGGQMQRVAIARALVNDPDIILADEPTGALDTETSIQVMELLKEVARDRLVIMVTHNPTLAKKYSTRTINLLDGEVIGDSNPYNAEEIEKKPKRIKKTSMKLITALSLSMSNLRTKKGRTILTSIAGSIGIIGIALVLAVSTGFSAYINKLQSDTLSVYPLTVAESSIDLSDFYKLSEEVGLEKFPKAKEVYTRAMFNSLTSMLDSNKITDEYVSFVESYIEESNQKANEKNSWDYCLQKGYGVDVNNYIYGSLSFSIEDVNVSGYVPVDMLIRYIEGVFDKKMEGTGVRASEVRAYISTMSEMPNSLSLMESQYEIIDEGGRWAENADEIMIVVDDKNCISDITLALLGFKQITGVDIEVPSVTFSSDEPIPFEVVKQQKFYYVSNDQRYQQVEDSNDFVEYTFSKGEIKSKGTELKITGIIRLKEGLSQGVLGKGGIAYTTKLTEKILEDGLNSTIAQTTKAGTGSTMVYSCLLPKGVYSSALMTQGYKIVQNKDIVHIASGIESEGNELAMTIIFEKNSTRLLAGDQTVNLLKIYSNGFSSKERLKTYLDSWNTEDRLEEDIVHYSDTTEFLFNALNTIVDGVKIVLICFTSISLIVSSVMIGIITYVSVVERTKEIGVLRSLGARKKDISRIFNAETFIIGFFAGLIGVVVTYLLSIPINIIVSGLIANVGNIASLKVIEAGLLIVISFVLTLISGLIPSKIAAKKDPVEALRSE